MQPPKWRIRTVWQTTKSKRQKIVLTWSEIHHQKPRFMALHKKECPGLTAECIYIVFPIVEANRQWYQTFYIRQAFFRFDNKPPATLFTQTSNPECLAAFACFLRTVGDSAVSHALRTASLAVAIVADTGVSVVNHLAVPGTRTGQYGRWKHTCISSTKIGKHHKPRNRRKGAYVSYVHLSCLNGRKTWLFGN